jgi:hypothetical protein
VEAMVEVTGRIKHETENALLLDADGLGEIWFPVSQVKEIHREKTGDRLVVTDWIARQKGII